MIIQEYEAKDIEEIYNLFYNTVHEINGRDYTKAACRAWASREVDRIAWNISFLKHHTYVAKKQSQIVGFGDIDRSGYLDRLYVHKNVQRCGIVSCAIDWKGQCKSRTLQFMLLLQVRLFSRLCVSSDTGSVC